MLHAPALQLDSTHHTLLLYRPLQLHMKVFTIRCNGCNTSSWSVLFMHPAPQLSAPLQLYIAGGGGGGVNIHCIRLLLPHHSLNCTCQFASKVNRLEGNGGVWLHGIFYHITAAAHSLQVYLTGYQSADPHCDQPVLWLWWQAFGPVLCSRRVDHSYIGVTVFPLLSQAKPQPLYLGVWGRAHSKL